MAASAELIARSAELKRALVEFAQSDENAAALEAFMAERLEGEETDEDQRTNVVDAFVLEHRSEAGRTLAERYAQAHPELPEAERAMLARWREVIHGVFVIQRRDSDALLLDNLIDELMYRVR